MMVKMIEMMMKKELQAWLPMSQACKVDKCNRQKQKRAVTLMVKLEKGRRKQRSGGAEEGGKSREYGQREREGEGRKGEQHGQGRIGWNRGRAA